MAVEEKHKPTCDEVLEACKLHVVNLEDERELLYKQVKGKTAKIIELESQLSPTPWYYYVLGGIAAGVVGRELLK